MDIDETARADLGGRLNWNGYTVACPECGAEQGFSIRAGTRPGENGEFAEVRCPGGHTRTHPLVYPAMVHYVVKASQEEGQGNIQVPGWRPHVRGLDPRRRVQPDLWLPWEQAAYLGPDWWQRHYPELVDAAFTNPAPDYLLLPFTLRMTLDEPAPFPLGTRWEVKVSERSDVTVITGPDAVTAIMQQVVRLVTVPDHYRVDEVRVSSGPDNDPWHDGWPWHLAVTLAENWPTHKTRKGDWICHRTTITLVARLAEEQPGSEAAPGRIRELNDRDGRLAATRADQASSGKHVKD